MFFQYLKMLAEPRLQAKFQKKKKASGILCYLKLKQRLLQQQKKHPEYTGKIK
jgi:hypothetical protein